jgi:hypothetical protein
MDVLVGMLLGSGANATQSVAWAQPTFSPTGLNNKPTVVFNGNSTFLQGSLALPPQSTIFAGAVLPTCRLFFASTILVTTNTKHASVLVVRSLLGQCFMKAGRRPRVAPAFFIPRGAAMVSGKGRSLAAAAAGLAVLLTRVGASTCCAYLQHQAGG